MAKEGCGYENNYLAISYAPALYIYFFWYKHISVKLYDSSV